MVSCEHGGNTIPKPYRKLFDGARALLESHRGYDPGALVMASELARALDAPLITATVSRLLVDLNRSIGHPRLHGESLRGVSRAQRAAILEAHYHPYRSMAEQHVLERVARRGRVVHLASHSFTPVLDGVQRGADVGLLYDPARPGEVDLCARWKAALNARAPALRVRRNYPYAGKGDGLTSYLRRRHDAQHYVGVELEINQKHVFAGGRSWPALRRVIIDALLAALDARPRLSVAGEA